MSEHEFTTSTGPVEVKVYFDYSPEESPTYFPSRLAGPGCPEELILNKVLHKEEDIMELLSSQVLQDLEREAFEYLKALSESYYDPY